MKKTLIMVAGLLLLATTSVRAATVTVNCSFYHVLDFWRNSNQTENWVGKTEASERDFVLRMPVAGLNAANYTAYYGWNGTWTQSAFDYDGATARVAARINFPKASDYGLAVHLKSNTGGNDYYCGNMVSHVYNTEIPAGGVVGAQGTCAYPGDGGLGYCSRGPATLSGGTFYGLRYLLASCSRSPATTGNYFSFDGGPAVDKCSTTASNFYYFPSGKTSVPFRMYPTTGAGDVVSANIALVHVYTPGSGRVAAPGAPVPSCYQNCVIDADCSGGLRCGYNVKVGRRVCSNSACPNEMGCKCSWQNGAVPLPTVKPQPTTVPQTSCYQPCTNDAECSTGLKCGYNVTVGKRVCSNSLCPRETTCKCSWQAGVVR